MAEVGQPQQDSGLARDVGGGVGAEEGLVVRQRHAEEGAAGARADGVDACAGEEEAAGNEVAELVAAGVELDRLALQEAGEGGEGSEVAVFDNERVRTEASGCDEFQERLPDLRVAGQLRNGQDEESALPRFRGPWRLQAQDVFLQCCLAE